MYTDVVYHNDLTVFQPYDFLSLIPVIEGAGGVITDWKGHQLFWEASANSHATSKSAFNMTVGRVLPDLTLGYLMILISP